MSETTHTGLQAILLFLLLSVAPALAGDEPALVAEAFSKAAAYIYYSSFEVEPVERAFSPKELKILDEHLEPLNRMIRDALGRQHSVGGAALTAYFGIEANLDLLRWQLLNPGRTYGWEGPDYSLEESYLDDGQYVYHSQYLKAIETLTGKPVAETIHLDEREREEILRLTRIPDAESHYWAIWISRKLNLM